MTTHTRTKQHEFITTRNGRIPTGKSPRGRQVRTNEETVTFWIEGIYELKSRGSVSPNSIRVDGDRIYSYGTHFEMARMIRNDRGKVVAVYVSADTWSGGGWTSTGEHQGYVRHAVSTHAKPLGIPVLEIPFSVVNAAGIDFESIRILENRESRYTYHEITSVDRPGECVYTRDENGDAKYLAPDERDGVTMDPTLSTVPWEKTGMAHARCDGHATLHEDGLWHWRVKRHWMGDSLIRGRYTEHRTRKLTPEEREQYDWFAKVNEWIAIMREEHRASFVEGEGYSERIWKQAEDLRQYMYELQSELPAGLSRHRTGEPNVSFTVQRHATFLSSFDYAEPNRPYFFCELPYGCKAQTVDEGIDALMPMEVRMHVSLGDDVKRQGDVYALPTNLTTDELELLASPVKVTRTKWEPGDTGYSYEKVDVKIRRRKADEQYPTGALDILGTNHQATHVILTKDGRWFGRGRMYHSPSNREPDHRVVILAKDVWYEFVKNTVPLAGGKRNASSMGPGGSIFRSHSARAWSVGGGVD